MRTQASTLFLYVLCMLSFRNRRLSKKINKKVMSMFEKAEQEYQDLVQRKSIIENDKSKIEKVGTMLRVDGILALMRLVCLSGDRRAR